MNAAPSDSPIIDGGNPLEGREVVINGNKPTNPTTSIEGVITPDKPAPPPSFWSRLQEVGAKFGPGLLSGIRLAGALDANNRIYGAALKGIRPDLKQSYNTYRQIVGDEATK